MQAKDLSHELRHTRTVCDTLKDEVKSTIGHGSLSFKTAHLSILYVLLV